MTENGFKNVYGTDIDDYVSEDNRKFFKEFKVTDLSFDKIPWPDKFFNLITGWCVVPHLENPYHFFREAHRVLADGGLVIVTMNNIASPPNRKYFYKHSEFPGYHEKNNHITLFTESTFKKTVLKNFDLIAKEYFISEAIFEGTKGKLRKLIFNFCQKNQWLKEKLDERWGAKVAYILQKKN